MADYDKRSYERAGKATKDVGNYLKYLTSLERSGQIQFFCIAKSDFDEDLWPLYSVPVDFHIDESIRIIRERVKKTKLKDVASNLNLPWLANLMRSPFNEFLVDATDFKKYGGLSERLDDIYVFDLARLKIVMPNLIQAISCYIEIGTHFMGADYNEDPTYRQHPLHRTPVTPIRSPLYYQDLYYQDNNLQYIPCQSYNGFPYKDSVITAFDSDGVLYNSVPDQSANPVAISSSIFRLIRILLTTHSILRIRDKKGRSEIEIQSQMDLIPDRPEDNYGYCGPDPPDGPAYVRPGVVVVNFPYLDRGSDLIEVIDWGC